MKIGVLSDTHSHMDEGILTFLQPCDEIWHAGDIGRSELVIPPLKNICPIRAVYGNIDDAKVRVEFPEHLVWELEGKKFFMTHIGGNPPKYAKGVSSLLNLHQPDVFITGHSHILKICPDAKRNVLFINPGAAGKHGFHKVRTLVRFDLHEGKLSNLEVLELRR